MECASLNYNQTIEAREYYKHALAPFLDVFNPVYGYVYRLLCVLGVFANAAIIAVLLRPAMRKSPFNVLLTVVATCDATLMLAYFIFKPVAMCHPWFFHYAWVLYTKFYACVSVFVHSVSLWLTVNMAVLRFLVLYRGSHANSRLPQCNGMGAAIVAIALGTLTAFLGSVINMLAYSINYTSMIPVPETCLHDENYKDYWSPDDMIPHYEFVRPAFWSCSWEKANYWIVAWMLKLIPCILLTIFMTLLVRMLVEARERRSRLCGGMQNTGNSQAERTTAMLVVIVAVFLITELPQGLMNLAAGINPRYRQLSSLLGSFFDLLSLTNSAVNFVLCALMSHVFRREFLKTFNFCCCWRTDALTRQTSLKTTARPRPTPSQDPSYSPMLPKNLTYE